MDKIGTPRHHRAKKANAVRNRDADAAAEADRDLRAANLSKAIRAAVEPLPPLADWQIDELCRQLRPESATQ